MKNSLTKGGVELSKVDDVDGTTLEGAVFNIVDMKGTVIRENLTTNSQGKISVSNLRPVIINSSRRKLRNTTI